MSVDCANLRRLIALAEAKFEEVDAEAGAFDPANYAIWRQRYDAAIEGLIIVPLCALEGAVFSSGPAYEYLVRMAGIRATSTSGYESALRNWCTAAVKKIQREERA